MTIRQIESPGALAGASGTDIEIILDWLENNIAREVSATHVIRFDRDDLTRADLATRATVINRLISSQTINPNEGRSWLDLPPREGGDKFLNPNISAAPAADPSKSGPIPDPLKNERNPEDDNATE